MLTHEQFFEYLVRIDAAHGEAVSVAGAIVIAEQYLNTAYEFKGNAVGDAAFPRDLWSEIPQAVLDALSELALRVTHGVALWSDYDPTEGAVSSESIGPISVSYTGAQTGKQAKFTVVDALLKPYLKNRTNSGRFVRG